MSDHEEFDWKYAEQEGADMLIVETVDAATLYWRCRAHCVVNGRAGRCRQPATYEFRWPGSAWVGYSRQCAHHCAWAWYVAQTMGFEPDSRSCPPIAERDDRHPTAQRARLLEVD